MIFLKTIFDLSSQSFSIWWKKIHYVHTRKIRAVAASSAVVAPAFPSNENAWIVIMVIDASKAWPAQVGRLFVIVDPQEGVIDRDRVFYSCCCKATSFVRAIWWQQVVIVFGFLDLGVRQAGVRRRRLLPGPPPAAKFLFFLCETNFLIF